MCPAGPSVRCALAQRGRKQLMELALPSPSSGQQGSVHNWAILCTQGSMQHWAILCAQGSVHLQAILCAQGSVQLQAILCALRTEEGEQRLLLALAHVYTHL